MTYSPEPLPQRSYTPVIVTEQGNPASTDARDPRGLVFNIMRFSLHDGPGIRTTVFLKGCPLRCSWCHNPESQSTKPEVLYSPGRCIRCQDCVSACPHGALTWADAPIRDSALCENCGTCAEACPTTARQIAGRTLSVGDLMRELRKDRVFFDESGGGVSFSGGEPLSQPVFLASALDACAAEGIHRVVDTSGFAPTEVIQRIAPKVDLFLFDLKIVDELRHKESVGVSNRLILENLRVLASSGASVMVRIPVVPSLNDDAVNLNATRSLLADLGLHELALLPYHEIGTDKYSRLGREYPLASIASPSPGQMEEIAERFRRDGFAVSIGG